MLDTKEIIKLIDALPEEVKIYVNSLKAAEINSQIFMIAGVPLEKQTELSFLIASVIVKKIKIVDFNQILIDFLSWAPDKVRSLMLEVVGSRLLIIDDWLDSEPSKYLLNNSVDLSRYAAITAEHQMAISKEEEFFRLQIEPEPDYISTSLENEMDDVLSQDIYENDDEETIVKPETEVKNTVLDSDIDIEAEKKSLLASLKSGLLGLFVAGDQDIIDRYNYIFVLVWSQDDSFKVDAPVALMSNQEKISKSKIVLDDKLQNSTIANLLKSFVKTYGIEANDLQIAEYLSSPAIKNFSEGEKALSLRILKFYKNINKLDEYLNREEEGQISNFEVLPSSALAMKEGTGSRFSKKKPGIDNYLSSEITVSQKNSQKLDKAIDDKNSLEAELEALLVNYTEGSLEHKTIAQELKRLQNKK